MNKNKILLLSILTYCLNSYLSSEIRCMEVSSCSDDLDRARKKLEEKIQNFSQHKLGDLCKEPNYCNKCENHERFVSSSQEIVKELEEKLILYKIEK